MVLDGSQSYDPDNDVLSFEWSLERAPTASNPQLSDTYDPQPVFTADMAGTYVYQLCVYDGYSVSIGSYVVVNVEVRPVPCEQDQPAASDFTLSDGIPLANPYNAGTWYWKVKAIDSYGNATESAVRSFTIE